MDDQQDKSDRSDRSDRSVGSSRDPSFRKLRPSGGYRKLRSFQAATIVYDATVDFCNRFIDKRSRTHDQMVQAARSGRQNIGEGSRASAISYENERRLVRVARASLDELLLDYEDFIRQHGYRLWSKDDPSALAVREIGRKRERNDALNWTDSINMNAYVSWLQHADPVIVANTMICLIHQANYLLDQQIAFIERKLDEESGHQGRSAASQDRNRQSHQVPGISPICPICGKTMILRTAR